VNLQRLIEEDNRAFEIGMESSTEQLLNLNDSLSKKIEEEVSARKEGEHRINKLFEEKVNNLKQDINQESRIRLDTINSLNLTLESDLPKLYENILAEEQQKHEGDQLILQKARDEI